MKLITFTALLLLSLTAAQESSSEPDTGALDSSASNGVDPITAPVPRPTIYGYVSGNDQYQILTAAFDALPNISVALDEPGSRWTLFAPTDSALREFVRQVIGEQDAPEVSDVVGQIVEGVSGIRRGPGFTDVRGIIFYHLLNRHYTFAELDDFGSITTAQGKNLTFVDGRVRDGDPSRGDANAFQKNIFTQNGWIHAVDSILLPFDLKRAIEVSRPSPTPLVAPKPDGDGVTETGEPSSGPDSPSGPVVVPGVDDTDDTDDLFPSGTDDLEPSASPDDDEGDDDGVCFPGTARVHIPGGSIAMEDLEAGQEVLHHESGKFSKVFMFTHRTKAHEGWFYRIFTSSGHAVTMTGNHYLYANGRLTAAHAVVVGDSLRTVGGVSPVEKIDRVKATGLYAPHSVHGDLVVDGVVVSGYSRAVRPGVAHAVLAPVRWLVKVTGIKEPFGRMLYEGGRGFENLMPKGKAVY